MAHEMTRRDPERIYLEPWPYSPEGRLWSEENVWPLYTWPPEPEGESERASGVEYIRSDLHAAEIAHLARELEEAREIIRDLVDDEDAGLVWLGRRLVCAYCTADGLYSVAHAADCPIIRARHAIAALRSEALGDGPVGAVCANCGAPNAAIAGGELDPDEAVCSSECYDQLKELGCPQEHGGDYRPRPARTNGGNDATT